MAWTEKQMDGLVNAVKGLVDRSIEPMRAQVRGLMQRADARYRETEALEARVAELERKLGQKSGAVKLIKG